MQDKVTYEWSVEIMDGEDIVDSNFADKLKDLDRSEGELVLVRRTGNEVDGETERLWAYVKDGKLPATFSDAMGTPIAYDVPKRFVKELEQVLQVKFEVDKTYFLRHKGHEGVFQVVRITRGKYHMFNNDRGKDLMLTKAELTKAYEQGKV